MNVFKKLVVTSTLVAGATLSVAAMAQTPDKLDVTVSDLHRILSTYQINPYIAFSLVTPGRSVQFTDTDKSAPIVYNLVTTVAPICKDAAATKSNDATLKTDTLLCSGGRYAVFTDGQPLTTNAKQIKANDVPVVKISFKIPKNDTAIHALDIELVKKSS